jgi:hypothetical protein
MPQFPCLTLAIDQLVAAGKDHFAIWVLRSPYPSGYVHHDCIWTEELTQGWQAWQDMFSVRSLPSVPLVASIYKPHTSLAAGSSAEMPTAGQVASYSDRLMQHLGISLWQWLFDGSIQSSLDQSQGIAIGQGKPLRLRLEIRASGLIGLPWETMQPQAGRQAISLSQQILFSRTTSDVDPLPILPPNRSLRILLVLGENSEPQDSFAGGWGTASRESSKSHPLNLKQEAEALKHLLQNSNRLGVGQNPKRSTGADCQVDALLQPTPGELIAHLESGDYNILFYSGHGMPGPDGGLLFLRPNYSLNGTELAQVLTRCRVTLAVFNACWGAQPDQNPHQFIPRSSLAEVLIHHGVPAVLAMRDAIADREALTFIQAFTKALSERLSIDQAVAVARQQLLTLYKFNQPAWTLPVLYMHPEFDGELLEPIEEGVTELPGNSPTLIGRQPPKAYLRSVNMPSKVWMIRDGLMRIGRREENDLVILEQWVSQRHAEIFRRETPSQGLSHTYYLRDFSRYGTLLGGSDGCWQRVHHQEVPLSLGVQLKFGSSQGQTLEFLTEEVSHSDLD